MEEADDLATRVRALEIALEELLVAALEAGDDRRIALHAARAIKRREETGDPAAAVALQRFAPAGLDPE